MMYRMFSLASLALALFVAAPALTARAADPIAPLAADAHTQDGKVVSIAGDKLVVADKDGKESTYALAADAKVTCDGTVSKASDLKPGMKIRVTMNKDEKAAVSRIEALDKNAAFEKPVLDPK